MAFQIYLVIHGGQKHKGGRECKGMALKEAESFDVQLIPVVQLK